MSLSINFLLALIFTTLLTGCVLEDNKSFSSTNTEEGILKSEPEVIVKPTPTLEVTLEPEVMVARTPIPEVVIEPEVIVKPTPTLEVTSEPEVMVEPTPIVVSEIICHRGSAMQQGHIKDIYSGRGIGNVLITINGCNTKTNSSGFYTLENIAESNRTTVTFKADKAYLQSTIVAVKEHSNDNSIASNYTEYAISKYASRWSYYSQKGINSTRVEIPTDAQYRDDTGKLFNGLVYAGWIFQDTMSEKGRDSFPGAYEGKNTNGIIVPFVSYGFVSLELKNKNATLLQVSGNISLKFNQIMGTKKDIISLWYYDYTQGLWIEEGYAQREENGTYVAQVSHAGTWCLSQAIEEDPGIYHGRIVDENGNPLSDVRLKAVGENWIGNDLSTDENGNFEIKVIPNSNFRLKAYNYKDKYAAEYSQEIAGIPSGIISED